MIVCQRCQIVTSDDGLNAHLWSHVMNDGTSHDDAHGPSCDWNLYRGERAMQGKALCNLGCEEAL